MLYRIIILTCLFAASTCFKSQAQGYNLDFTIDGLSDSTAYLGYHFGLKKYVTDTSDVSNGKIHFDSDKPLPKGIYFLYSKSFYMEFVITPDQQNFSVETSKDDIYSDIKIKKSTQNVVFADFQKGMTDLGKKSKELRDELSTEGLKAKDSTKIIDKLKLLNEETETLKKKYRENDPGAFVSQLLHLMQLPEPPAYNDIEEPKERAKTQFYYIKNHYFDNINLADSGLIRTPLYHNRILDYVNKYTIQHPDSIFKSIKFILDASESSRELYRYWAVNFTSEYQNPKIMGMDKVFILMAEQFYLKGKFPWVEEDVIKKVKEEVKYLRPTLLESKAPDFIAQDTSGVSYRLYNLVNDYIICFFYSPTCGHCKKKTPIVLEAFHNLQKDNINAKFLGVCTETDKDKWTEFIKEYKADWVNLADLGYKSNFRADYNVRTTPTIVILDKNKKVIAKKLDAEQVEKFIRDQVERDADKKAQ